MSVQSPKGHLGRLSVLIVMTVASYFITVRVAYPDPPPCDGTTLVASACGEARLCIPSLEPCSGTTVISLQLGQCQPGSSANELCVTNPSLACTETKTCVVSDAPPIEGVPGLCVPGDAVMYQGQPVVSYSPGGELVPCQAIVPQDPDGP